MEERSSQELSVFNLTIEGFKLVQKYGIDLNHLFVLECLSEGSDLGIHLDSSKIKAWKQNLYRKSLLTDKGEITVVGKELLVALATKSYPEDVVKKVRKKAEDEFEKWWKEYPSTDMFEWQGQSFYGSRGIKVKKEDCRKKFNEILLEGEFNSEDMIRALQVELFLKKNQSVKDKENKLKYMQNTLTYLNQRTFENFVHQAGQVLLKNNSSSSSSSNTVDI